MNMRSKKPANLVSWISRYPLLRKYLPLVHEDLGAIYFRSLHKWLFIAPIVGVTTGLAITAIAVIILKVVWPPILGYYLHHHWAMVPGVTLGFVADRPHHAVPHARPQ